jgi:hypothetical protein
VTDELLGSCAGMFARIESVLRARTRTEQAACWGCGEPSWRVHSHYRRRHLDGAVAGRLMTVVLQVKRFFCDNESYPSQIS